MNIPRKDRVLFLADKMYREDIGDTVFNEVIRSAFIPDFANKILIKCRVAMQEMNRDSIRLIDIDGWKFTLKKRGHDKRYQYYHK